MEVVTEDGLLRVGDEESAAGAQLACLITRIWKILFVPGLQELSRPP